jgi:AraC-like DNA-binding protein
MYSTDAVAPADQLEYWRDAVCDVFIHLDVSPLPALGAAEFNGQIVQHATGILECAEVLADGHVAIRSMNQISRESEDCFLVLVQRLGKSWVEQDGRGTWLQPGEFTLCDSTRPYQMHLPERFHHQVVKIPGRALRESVRVPERLTARAIAPDHLTARLFLNAVAALSESTEEISVREAAGIADSLVGLLGAAISSLPEAMVPVPSNMERYHTERVKKFVLDHLFDSALTVEQIAAQVRLSPRHVHALFESEPMTLVAWIWHERLKAGRRALMSFLAHSRSVTDIAYSVGFKDPAHFSRMFKSSYGLTPREFRKTLADDACDHTDRGARGAKN